ncbi:MAG: hypothetical protein PHV82_03115 [Victivallaceae bacterium]|nr:hypothetical protein [Victivallaceae bacterium]
MKEQKNIRLEKRNKTFQKVMSTLFLISSIASMSINAELISEWKFDGNTKDSKGRNHGKLIGNSSWTKDRFRNQNKALELDGKKNYIYCGKDSSLSFGNGKKDLPFSIAAWVKMNDRSDFIIVHKIGEYLLTNNNHFRLYLYDHKTGKRIYKSGGDLISYTGEWIYLVVTCDGSGTVDGIKFYVNGKLVTKTGQGNEGKTYIAMKNKGGIFCIGDDTTKGCIDDVRIYSHALSAAEIRANYNKLYSVSANIKKLENMINKLAGVLNSLSRSYSSYTQAIDLSDYNKKLKNLKDKNQLSYFEVEQINGLEDKISLGIKELTKIQSALKDGRLKTDNNYICYVVPPISDQKILPFWGTPIPGKISDELRITACAGEYEPASFVITALSDITSLQAKATDLKRKSEQSRETATIPSSGVDIKLVKCWYQAGTAWRENIQDKSKRLLVPELLVNDDSLVKVDFEKKENYLKLSFPEGDKYVWISDPSDKKTVILTPKEFPVKDSPHLLPVNIPAARNQQFWITIKVPDNAKPGTYTGKINLSTPRKFLGWVNLELNVLPFKLSDPYYTFSIDYHGNIHRNGSTTNSFVKTKEQFKNDLENMVRHGLSTCHHYFIEKEELEEVLRIRQKVGMDNKTLYLKESFPPLGPYRRGIGNPTLAEELKQLKKNVREIIELAKPYGVETVYFYGIDEVQGDLLKSQRPAWEAVHEAGGKVFVAGRGDNIKMMGDIQDLHIKAYNPSKEEADRWHAYGHKILCYANPQAGVENPEIYRRNFGLLLWKCDYDGANDNAYQHSFGNTWNDFDHPEFRSHSITYPAANGPIDTIAWEGYREAADDVRYVTTLEKMIEKTKKSDVENSKALLEAEKYLKKLKSGNDIETKNLDDIRSGVINQILKLQNQGIHHK